MKKTIKNIFSFILACIVLICAVSCGKGDDANTTSGSDGAGDSGGYSDSLGLLDAIWDAYADGEKFPACGGDESNLNFEGPGKYSVESAEMLDSSLGLPASLASKIDSAASLSHAMNANTFTCGAFRFKNADDAVAAVSSVKTNILARHWICGFPDSLLIITAPGNYVIAVWGIEKDTGVVSTFKNKVMSAIEGSSVVVDEPIV